MSGALAKYMKSTSVQVSEQDMARSLQETADDAATGAGAGVSFLQFSGKSGEYRLGKNKDTIDPEQLFLVEPQTFNEGWVCWYRSKPVARHEWSVYARDEQSITEAEAIRTEPKQVADARKDHELKDGDGWKKMLGFGCIACDELKENIMFQNNSVSGVNTISDLMTEIGKRAALGEPSMPVIKFGEEQFEAQGYTQWKPVLDVEVWVDRQSAAAYLDPEVAYRLEDLLEGRAVPKKRGAAKKAASRRK